MTIPILFILMRTDLASMNPGKAMAQASHASNAALSHAYLNSGEMAKEWAGSTSQSFGTVLVLDGGRIEDIAHLVAQIEAEAMIKKHDEVVAGLVHDPSYPIRDGQVTHHLPLVTCAYVMTYQDSPSHRLLKDLRLHK